MIHVISLGLGVQSSTLLFMAEEGLVTPRPAFGVFADTGDEPLAVYAWHKVVQDRATIKLHTIKFKTRLSDSMLTIHKSRKSGKNYQRVGAPFFTIAPDGKRGILRRTCTANFKIRPIVKFIRDAVGREALNNWRRKHKADLKILNKVKRDQKANRPWDSAAHVKALEAFRADPLVTVWIGISKDEAIRVKPSPEPWILHRYPLIEANMSRKDCLEWMKSRNLPKPPRSACTFCPYHSNEEWLRLQRESPKEFEAVVAFEKKVRDIARRDETLRGDLFLHSDRKPLDQIDFTRHGQEELWGNECEGMCGQ